MLIYVISVEFLVRLMRSERFCVVVICVTLFSEYTTVGLVRSHIFRTGRPHQRLILCLLSWRCSPTYCFFLVFEEVSRKHILKLFVLRFLNGVKVESLEQSANEYLQYLLSKKKQDLVWARLKECKGETFVLASASVEPFVSVLGSKLSMQYVATQMECKEGTYSGRLLHDATARKLGFLSSQIQGFSPSLIATVITDNLSDRDLLCIADKPVVVLNRSKDRLRWKGLEAEYLEVWR